MSGIQLPPHHLGGSRGRTANTLEPKRSSTAAGGVGREKQRGQRVDPHPPALEAEANLEDLALQSLLHELSEMGVCDD